jgi:hypothetical protein
MISRPAIVSPPLIDRNLSDACAKAMHPDRDQPGRAVVDVEAGIDLGKLNYFSICERSCVLYQSYELACSQAKRRRS